MPLLEDLLSPASVTLGIILSLILALFIYFRQAIDALKDILNKELSIISERLIRLELEIGYRKELIDLREDNNELRRKLSELQKRKNV